MSGVCSHCDLCAPSSGGSSDAINRTQLESESQLQSIMLVFASTTELYSYKKQQNTRSASQRDQRHTDQVYKDKFIDTSKRAEEM